ncbi:MAG: hypothetical protein U0R65_02105 [Candidatus Nanopelagicales bacterium]
MDEVDTRAPAVVVDLCCGAGALAVAIAAGTRPGSIRSLHAADVDPRATACAEAIRRRSGAVHLGDLFDALPPELCGSVDVLVVNAPHTCRPARSRPCPRSGAERTSTPWRWTEGLTAWTHQGYRGRGVGLAAHRRRLLVETSDRQADATMAVLARRGLTTGVVDDDVVVARGRRAAD